MAVIPFNVALGREVEFYNRVLNNDPTNAVIVLMVLTHSGLESNATLRLYDTFAAILASTNNEVTNAGYSRLILDQTDLDTPIEDTDLNTITLPLDDQTFPTISAGDNWSKLVFGYDSDSTGGTDANIVPFASQDLRDANGQVGVPNGNDIFLSFPYGILTAS